MSQVAYVMILVGFCFLFYEECNTKCTFVFDRLNNSYFSHSGVFFLIILQKLGFCLREGIFRALVLSKKIPFLHKFY